MVFQSRIPIPVHAPTTRNLHKIRSEGYLKDPPTPGLRRLRSMGQLPPPPDIPLPPLPPRSSLRPLHPTHSIDSRLTLDERTTYTHQSAVFDSRSYSSNDSQELVLDSGRSSPSNTILVNDHVDQEKIESQVRSNSEESPSLKDLGRLLELCNLLKEMGVLFTKQGEMHTYGNPPLKTDLERMLRLGTEYDELWNTLFNSQSREVAHNLWPVVRVLGKMLKNEGIVFDDHHRRLNYGSGLPKHIRLGSQYDILRQEWFDKTLSNIHPAERWQQTPAQVRVPNTPVIMSSSLDRDELPEDGFARKSRRAKRLTRIAEEQPDVRNGPRSTIQEVDTAYTSPPDTFDTPTDAHSPTPASAYSANTTRLYEPTTATLMTLHGSSPLQRANTVSMLLADDDNSSQTQTVRVLNGAKEVPHRSAPRQHEHAGVLERLVEDERRRAEERRRHAEQRSASVPLADEEKKTTSNKKGKSKAVKNWLRTILGLKKYGE